MRIGLILNTSDPETVWNVFRLALAAVEKKHNVKVFLLGNGVEVDQIYNPEFNVEKETTLFKEKGGEILACGTCLYFRGKGKSNVCPISSMDELVKIIEESDKIINFG
ncbi:DsrE family protein [Candidatus Micrarchaeota archaeon]|nr:DsrE family protein [Candidatus Micrarchaeota archaeon]